MELSFYCVYVGDPDPTKEERNLMSIPGSQLLPAELCMVCCYTSGYYLLSVGFWNGSVSIETVRQPRGNPLIGIGSDLLSISRQRRSVTNQYANILVSASGRIKISRVHLFRNCNCIVNGQKNSALMAPRVILLANVVFNLVLVLCVQSS